MTNPNPALAARKVLTKIGAYDPFFSKPAESILVAWTEQIAATNLTEDELLAAVAEVYRVKESGFRPLPADVLNTARRLRRERFDALPLAEQQAIRDAETRDIDAELAELEDNTPAVVLAHRMPDNPAKGPRWVRCTYCGAHPGDGCFNRGRPELKLGGFHPARFEVCNPTVAPKAHQAVLNRYLNKAAGDAS
jgi:hypothetical protein